MLFGLAMLRENVKTAKVWCHNYFILLYSAAQLCTVKKKKKTSNDACGNHHC